MLERLRRLSSACSRYRFLSVIFGAVFLMLFLYSLFNNAPGGVDLLVPGVVGLAWSLAFYGFAGLFPGIPDRPSAERGWFRRAGRRIHRFAFHVLAVGFIGLTFALVYLSVKMLAIWLGEMPG